MKKIVIVLSLLSFNFHPVLNTCYSQQNESKVRLNRRARFFIHMKALENQTKIKISIDKESLAKHGISINENIDMDYREYTLEEAMDILVVKLSHTNPDKVFWAKTVAGDIIVFGAP